MTYGEMFIAECVKQKRIPSPREVKERVINWELYLSGEDLEKFYHGDLPFEDAIEIAARNIIELIKQKISAPAEDDSVGGEMEEDWWRLN